MPREARRDVAEQDDADAPPVRRGQERRRVGAERVERDVAKVEQAGEPDDDIQADGHPRLHLLP